MLLDPLADGVTLGESCDLDKAAPAINALAYPDVEARISQSVLFIPPFHAGDAELRVYSPAQVKRFSEEITVEQLSKSIDMASETLFADQDIYPFSDTHETPQSARIYLLEHASHLVDFLNLLRSKKLGMFGVMI